MVALTREGANEWTRNHNSSINAVASCIKESDSGSYHVCTGLTVYVTGGTAKDGPFVVELLSSTTALWAATLGTVSSAGSMQKAEVSNLYVRGATGQPLILHTSPAGSAGSIHSVAMRGYSVNDPGAL